MRRTSLAALLLTGLLIVACRPGEGETATPTYGDPLDYGLAKGELAQGQPAPLLDLLDQELQRNLARLQEEDVDVPAYFMAYDVVSVDELWMEARHGALVKDHMRDDRVVDVDVRVGGPELDNGHTQGGNYVANGLGAGLSVAKHDDPLALAQALWVVTESQYRDALDAFSEAESHESMLTRDDEPMHPDFSEEEPVEHIEATHQVDLAGLSKQWGPTIAELSTILGADPLVYDSTVVFMGRVENRTFVNSEGSRVQAGRTRLRVILSVATQAEDGMILERFHSFDVHGPDQLPQMGEMKAKAEQLRGEVLALRKAPLAEPYTGPAVLTGPAAGVFFHEIFGHRLEGHRQKDDLEGQTFTEMLERPVLPAFLDVVDDPTALTLRGKPLNGHYFIDEEGVDSQRTVLVEEGVLKGFLLGRSPVLPFEHSNGHGRREPGYPVVARQGNLIINSRNTIPEGELRDALIAEAKAQGKPYGLWFTDVTGGYTITDRSGPQAFKVQPLMVYRVYTDGRPDELVRGADIVGTPLAAFETIIATGDEPGIFNGMCGAESGWVPVSAVSPSLLLSNIEIERSVHDRDRPPLLPAPKAFRAHQLQSRGESN